MFWEVWEAEDVQEVYSHQILGQKGHSNHWEDLRWVCGFEQVFEMFKC